MTTKIRVEPQDEEYLPLYQQWIETGKPARLQKGLQGYLAIRDNDQLVFIKDGPPIGYEGYYNTSSFGSMNK